MIAIGNFLTKENLFVNWLGISGKLMRNFPYTNMILSFGILHCPKATGCYSSKRLKNSRKGREGKISILMHSGSLEICNTGEENSLTNETIFNRFVSGNPKSYGLGLAIVRKICETHELEINYTRDKLHCFVLKTKS